MNNSLKTFMAVTLAFLGFAIGNACVEKPEHDLAAQKKMLEQGNRVNRNQINRNAIKKARRGKAVANPRYKINADGPWKGEKDALVTIVEVSDFQCPFCNRVNPTMKKIMEEYKGDVRVM
jgi:protein-disulfide isomerase